jgi:hypothetical protein
MRFHEILLEQRRNPDQNFKRSIEDQLRPYEGRKDVFVSYTEDVGNLTHMGKAGSYGGKIEGKNFRDGGVSGASGKTHNTRGAKLGINPQSSYRTPLGIYAYPIDYVLHKGKGGVEFASTAPYIQVFEISPSLNVLDLAKVSVSDVRYASSEFNEVPDDDLPVDTEGGALWNVLYKAALEKTKMRLVDPDLTRPEWPDEPEYEDFDSEDEWEEALETHAGAVEQYHRDLDEYETQNSWADDEESLNPSLDWNKILRKMGYDGVLDYDWSKHEGQGIIHENEPSQAVFMSMKGIKLLQTVNNRYEGNEPKSNRAIWSAKPQIFINQMRQGKLSDDEIISFLYTSSIVLSGLGNNGIQWSDLPKSVQDRIMADPLCAMGETDNLIMSIAPFGDKQVIEIISETPRRAVGRKLSAGVQQFILQNHEKFRKYYQGLRMSQANMETLIARDPHVLESWTGGPGDVPPFILQATLDHDVEMFARKYYASYEANRIPMPIFLNFLDKLEPYNRMQMVGYMPQKEFTPAQMKMAVQKLDRTSAIGACAYDRHGGVLKKIVDSVYPPKPSPKTK